MDDRLRSAARRARAEIESALDSESELTALHAAAAAGAPSTGAVTIAPAPRRRTPALLGAAAVIAVVGSAIWLTRPDDTITTSAPATTLPVSPTSVSPTTSTSGTSTPVTTEQTTAPTTLSPSTTAASTTTTSTPPASIDAVDWRDLRWELTVLTGSCVAQSLRCTQVVHDDDGTPISYQFGRYASLALTRHSVPSVSATLPEAYGDTSAVVAVGPDDVVYLRVDPTVRSEETMAIVAVSLADGDAGREIARWDDAWRLGPTQLVPGPGGLVECCDTSSTVPPPDATVIVPWVDRDGQLLAAAGPLVTVVVDDAAITVRRTDADAVRSWPPVPLAGSIFDGRFQRVVPTFDGGFITLLDSAEGTTIVRGYADGRVARVLLDQAALIGGVESVDPSGRVLVQSGTDTYARVDPFPGTATTWGGAVEVDVGGTGAIGLPGIDEAIDAGPTWANDPAAFAAAVAGEPEVNEQRTIDAAEQEDGEVLVTVTTSNLFDDSVFATRWELVLRRDDTGNLRFVSGQWTQACQPGRGHQDFRAGLCV